MFGYLNLSTFLSVHVLSCYDSLKVISISLKSLSSFVKLMSVTQTQQTTALLIGNATTFVGGFVYGGVSFEGNES